MVTDDQSDLFAKRRSRADQIFERFVRFHRANPRFWLLFCQFADNMRRIRPHYSARAIFQRVRWEMDLATEKPDNDGVELNDHYSPYYARMYLATHPAAKDFFELRKRTSEDRSAYKTDLAAYHTGPADDEDDLMDVLRELGNH